MVRLEQPLASATLSEMARCCSWQAVEPKQQRCSADSRAGCAVQPPLSAGHHALVSASQEATMPVMSCVPQSSASCCDPQR
jgi:hypothetical protein